MAINRFETLNRHELPIQAVLIDDVDPFEVSIPVHLSILTALVERGPVISRLAQDQRVLKGAHGVVSTWYNEDIEYHLDSLDSAERAIAAAEWVNYLRFSPDWTLSSARGVELLDLVFRNGPRTDYIKYTRKPNVFLNMRKEDGKYLSTDDIDGSKSEVVSRIPGLTDVVAMDPQKMCQYGFEAPGVKADQQVNYKVVGTGFKSDLLTGSLAIPRAFALRDYAVFYQNRLLEHRALAFN